MPSALNSRRFRGMKAILLPSLYRKLGIVLANSGDLFCRAGYDGGLLLVQPDGSSKSITSAADLAPIIVDRVALSMYLDGKPKGSKLSAAHMNAMLRTKAFLSEFAVVDHISTVARYLPGFRLTKPGYNDGGDGHRYFFVGESPQVFDSMDRINAFLDVMDFETQADRTNSLAAGTDRLIEKPLARWQANSPRHGLQEPLWKGHGDCLRLGRDGTMFDQLSGHQLGARTHLRGGVKPQH
jgi:hypothetical protein